MEVEAVAAVAEAVAEVAVAEVVEVAEARPMNSDLPALGVGIGFREPFRADLFLNRDRVDFLEVTADHYFDAPREKQAELDLLAAHFPLIPHGLDLSLGSVEGVDDDYLAAMADLVVRLDPRGGANISRTPAPATCRSDTSPPCPGIVRRSTSSPATSSECGGEFLLS